ncbi:CHRD domain-containing protein [Chitinophaga sp. YIM B06452]|uniref:CHRD domain-containing protein n=1 Tax=Chitinophaga sp. YIM B06452 TaxID=3082158 RepID=UPI0031FEC97D
MKKMYAWVFIVMGLFCTLAVACSKDDDKKEEKKLYKVTNAPMTGAQENPANASAATGSFDATYNPESKELTITVRWQGLTGNATLMHIHGPAARGVNAGVLHNFATLFSSTASGSFTTKFIINGTTEKEEDLLAGKWYVNIHTAAFGGGEIRGQIELTY